MAKAKKTIFFCQQCGYETAKWMGQCPGCREWNTFVEEPAEEKHAGISAGNRRNSQSVEPMPLSRVETVSYTHLDVYKRQDEKQCGYCAGMAGKYS